MAYNCNHQYHRCHEFPCCNQTVDDYNLIRLKSTNNELKSLIRKIDDITDSIVETKKQPVCFCHKINNFYHVNDLVTECDECRDKRIGRNYEYVMCEDCDQLLKVNKLIDQKVVKKDPHIYPLETFPCGKQRNCSDCDRCTRRSRRNSRSRSRSASRTRSLSQRRRHSSSEMRPVWNGGKTVY